MNELQKGQVVRTKGFKSAEVLERLGEGGQGIVYKIDYDGKPMALKWYLKSKLKNPDKFYDNIKNNIDHNRPTDAFLWPEDITEWVGGTFGYIMPLRPSQYGDFSKYLLAKVKFKSVYALLNAALNIVEGFAALHRAGYNYQDLNDGNFFVNFETGDVLICDNDNVMGHGFNSGIAGKCRYMAPEVVLGKMPDRQTDRFSLAVVLFLLLLGNHPLEGKATNPPCLTEEWEKVFYGIEPVFIFDPTNTSNIPIHGIHRSAIAKWPKYPEYIRETFISAFSRDRLIVLTQEQRTCFNREQFKKISMTEQKRFMADFIQKVTKEGFLDPKPRLMEKEWLETFIRLRSEIIQCGCGRENFTDPINGALCQCGRQIKIPAYLKFKKLNVPLYPTMSLFACHTISDSEDFKTPTAEVIVSKNNPGNMGIRNLSDITWYVTGADGKSIPREKGEVVKIASGLTINFGKTLSAVIVGN